MIILGVALGIALSLTGRTPSPSGGAENAVVTLSEITQTGSDSSSSDGITEPSAWEYIALIAVLLSIWAFALALLNNGSTKRLRMRPLKFWLTWLAADLVNFLTFNFLFPITLAYRVKKLCPHLNLRLGDKILYVNYRGEPLEHMKSHYLNNWLCLLTFGIYGIFYYPKLYNEFFGNIKTSFGDFSLNLTVKNFFISIVLAVLSSVIFIRPFVFGKTMDYILKNAEIKGESTYRLKVSIGAMKVLKRYIRALLLSVVSLGIYAVKYDYIAFELYLDGTDVVECKSPETSIN